MNTLRYRSLLFRVGVASLLLVCAPTLFVAWKTPSQQWEKAILAFEAADK